MAAVMEAEGQEIAGKKGMRNPERTAQWWGSERGGVYYDGWKVLMERPRLKGMDKREIPLTTYKVF